MKLFHNNKKSGVMVITVTVGFTAVSYCQGAVSTGRYDVILNRKPFGVQPAVVVEKVQEKTEVVESQPAPLFLDDLVMRMLRDSSYGARVGFQNKKTNRSYCLGVGQSSDDGITVLDINFSLQSALLSKEGVKGTLYMDPALTQAKMVSAATIMTPPSTPKVLSRGPSAVTTARPSRTGLTKEEYANTRESRFQPMSASRHKYLAENPDVQVISGEEREKRLREYNLKLIRSGGALGPALPIELTPEEDAMLVREGVLPPAE